MEPTEEPMQDEAAQQPSEDAVAEPEQEAAASDDGMPESDPAAQPEAQDQGSVVEDQPGEQEEPAEEPVVEAPAARVDPAPEPEAEPEEPQIIEPVAEEPAAQEESESEPEPEPEPVASAELVAAVEEAFEGAEPVEEEPKEIVLDWVPGDWYVVHTYAGYENKVKADLESRVASMNMEESIYEVVIPMEEVMEIKSGKKQMVPRKVFPGYLLVRMDLNDDSWYVVRNTPGVTGFVGSGNKPIPLSEKEVDKILRRKGEPERPKPATEWQVNDPVRVTTGPFANFQGSISEVDGERQKVKVLVNIFGRETPVELSFDQIAKV